MKKVVLALAVAAVSISASAVELGIYKDDLTKVTLFGEIRTRFSKVMQSDETVNKDEKLRFSMNSSRLGVQGTHELSDTANALGYIRLRYDDPDASSKNNSFDVDKSWMGISTCFGTFKVGRIGSIQDDDMAFYDVSSQLGMEISTHNALSGTGIQDGVIEYGWSNDNFSVRAQGFAAVTQVTLPNKATAKLDCGFAVGGSWVADFGLGLHLAYTRTHVSDIASGSPSSPSPGLPILEPSRYHNTLSSGISYTVAGLSLAAVASGVLYRLRTRTEDAGGYISKSDPALKEKDWGLSVKYLFDFGLGTYIVYEKSALKDFSKLVTNPKPANKTVTAPYIDRDQYTGGIEYRPLEQLLSFVELSQIKTKKVKKATMAWAVGTRFYF